MRLGILASKPSDLTEKRGPSQLFHWT